MKKKVLSVLAFFVMILSLTFILAAINSSDIQLTSPANNSYTNDNTTAFVFNVTSTLNATGINCSVYLNNSLKGYNESTFNATSTTITSAALAEEFYYWHVNCTDVSGTNKSVTKLLFVDISSPLILELGPENEYFSNETSFNFDYNITDNFNNTVNCSFIIDGIDRTHFNATLNQLDHDNYGPYLQGLHNWSLNCSDEAGNVNTSSIRNFTVDTTAPAYSGNSTNSTSPGEYVSHRLYWQDTYGLAGYIFSFNNGSGTFVNDSWIIMTGTGNWSNVTKAINSTLLTNISWKVYANDSAGNWNESMRYNYTALESIAPALTLNSPAVSENLSNTNVTFNCSATDTTELSNISLYGNWTSWGEAKNSSNVTGLSNSSQWTNILTTNATYKWACYACDNLSNCGFSSNQTFIIDTNYPRISLVYPEDDNNDYNLTSGGTKSVTFTYNVTRVDNFGIDYCTLYIDSVAKTNDTSVSENQNGTISYTFTSDDVYGWKVRCFDYSGNGNYSLERTIIINPYHTSSSSGDSGGGGADDTEDNCPPNEKRCSGGNVEQCLNDEWKVVTNCSYGCNTANFTCKTLSESAYSGNNLTYLKNKTFDYLEINETIDFVLDNSTHTIFIKNITNSSVTLEINSTVITTTLAVNETKTFDLNGNGHDDFSVTLVSIVDDTTTLLLNSIEEPKAGGILGSKPFLNFDFGVFTRTLVEWRWYILIFLGVVVAIFVAIIIVKKKKKSGKFAYVKINNKFVKIKKRQDGGIRIEKNGNVS